MNWHRNIIQKAALGIVAVPLAFGSISANAADMGAVDEPIKLALNEWSGQHITTRVAGGILERMGYQVEYVTAG